MLHNHKIFFAIIFCFHCVCIYCEGIAEYKMDKEREDISFRAVSVLEQRTSWIIKNSLSLYYEQGENAVIRIIEDGSEASLYTGKPYINKDGFIARFMLERSGILYDTIIFKRDEINGYIYEYWVVTISGATWANVKRNQYFIITKAANVDSKREILKATTQYFESYPVNDIESINFPIDDDFSMYFLNPWNFPNNYEGYDYPDYKYIALGDDNYKKEKVGYFEKKRLLKIANRGYFSKEIPFEGVED